MPGLALQAQLRQTVGVLPQLVLRSELLGLTGDELEARVKDELDTNPALDLDERKQWPAVQLVPDFRQRATLSRSTPDPPASAASDTTERLRQKRGLRDDLLWQLQLLGATRLHSLCVYLIHSIAPTGYLEVSVEEVASELETPLPDVERALEVVQGLSPTGVGARDLRECLLLQLRACDPAAVPDGAEVFIREHLHAAARGRDRAARSMRLSLEQVDAILEFIRQHLSPYPGLAYQSDVDDEGAGPVRPDVILREEGGEVVVEVPESVGHGLRVNLAYAALERTARHVGNCRTPVSLDRDARQAVLGQIRQARQFIANLQRRYDVLRIVTEAVVAEQHEFLTEGPEYLKPLDKKAIAARTGLHESTVCRATRGKHVQRPDGVVMPFDVFFDDALPVKYLVRHMIQTEDPAKPLSDEEIAARLKRGGHEIARRTVAKYRAEMGIDKAGERLGGRRP